MEIFWIILSYLLGSVPFGYLIARMFGIDILSVGFHQIGATTVFQNVGKWQGVLVGVLDAGKGFLAVFGAQKLGLGPEIQALAGAAAIAGHNWPVFLKFSGGRGIATLVGAGLVLSPLLLAVSFVPAIILTLIWDSSAATLIFLFTALGLSFFYKMNFLITFFILAIILVLIARAFGKVKEVFPPPAKAKAFFSRLIFDRLSGPEPFPRWKKKTKDF
jgi:glycerol-3-phosphate acyltransferase PlsY